MQLYNSHVLPKQRFFSTTPGTGGQVTVLVHDLIEEGGNLRRINWQFSFKPEPGDVLAQVERRLAQ